MPPPDPMLAIWDKVSQPSPDGQRYIQWRTRDDIDYLYDTGFVDTNRYKKEDWIDAFKDSLQPDKTYRITKAQWLAKKPYRYNGPTGAPFDPLSLREGEWEIEEFEKILREKVFPSTTLSEEIFRKAIDKGREKAFVGGKFILSKAFKFALKQAFLLHPSPRRFRELAVAEARDELNKSLEAAQKARRGYATKSGYVSGPSNERAAVDRLSRLLWKGNK